METPENIMLREALRTIMATHSFGSPANPLQRMARAALEGDAQAMHDARRQLQLQSQGRIAKVLPDELPTLWDEQADRIDGHGVRSQLAETLRRCAIELTAALAFRGYKYPSAFAVGLYHKQSTHDTPYHQRIIRYKDTADACVKQWSRTQASPDVEIRVKPLYEAVVPLKFDTVYQIVSAETDKGVHWRDVSKSEWESVIPSGRRILWSENEHST